jgi:hypothetical protein
MIQYKYKKIKGHDQKKFTEDGHTMFEEDVLMRLKRLAYLEDQIAKSKKILTHDEVFKFANKLAISGYGREAVMLHGIANKLTNK